MKKLYLVAIVCTIAAWASCKKEAMLYYKVKNIASDSVLVVRSYANSIASDTFYISYNQTMVVAVISPGNNHISKYRETGTRMSAFNYITIYKNFKPARTDFMQRSKWAYIEKGNKSADYLTTVTDADF